MFVVTRKPQPPLSRFVDYFWYMRGYQPPHARELALPDGSAEIVFDLRLDGMRLYDRADRERILGSAALCGPHSDYFVIDSAGEAEVAGIHFKPGGLRPFVREPLSELLNKHVSLEELWGARAGELLEGAAEALSPEAVFDALETGLTRMACRELSREPSVDDVFRRLHLGESVGELIERTGVSHRTFNERFKEEIGMTPKRAGRLIRFQRALAEMEAGREVDWADLALSCGYYDQSHWIKDFRAFSGINPSEYRPIAGRHRNHAPLVR